MSWKSWWPILGSPTTSPQLNGVALYFFWQLLETAGAANSSTVEKLVDYSWVADGITQGEVDGLNVFSELLGTAGDANSSTVEKLVDYSWVADGMTHDEAGGLNFISKLLETAGDAWRH